jgi:cell division protein FtsB
MSSVKGSAQYRMVVMPYRPMRRVFNVFLIFMALLITATASFFYGYDQGLNQRLSGGILGQSGQEFKNIKEEAEILRQEVANLKLAAVVDQQAQEDVRHQAIEQKDRIASLERDIAVYRGMMSKSDNANPSGITIGNFQVSGSGGVRGHKYKLVVQQLAANKGVFNGTLVLNIVGIRAGSKMTIPLHEVSSQIADVLIPLEFRYFQSIEGSLILPEGFEPERVDVVIKSTNKKTPTNVERQLDWPVLGL